jgi:flagellar motor switch/type III secretory pathway protein FliN
VGDYAAEATSDLGQLGGSVVIAGPFIAVPSRSLASDVAAIRERVVKEPTAMSNDSSDDRALNVISNAPIEVVAEVGRLSLRGEEVLGLQPGSVLAFGHQGQSVSLVVGGQPWAKGELVNVDGELGVRITELARG